MTYLIGTIHHRCETNPQLFNIKTDILHTELVWLSRELILSVKFLFFQLPLVHNTERLDVSNILKYRVIDI